MIRIGDGMFPICAGLFLLNFSLFFTDCATTRTDFPWNVMITTEDSDDVKCFGTIISPRLILTTELCLYNKRRDGTFYYNTNVEAHKAIVMREDPQSYQAFLIEHFRLFKPIDAVVDGNRAHEPMIIILYFPIDFDSDVQPANVHWTNPRRVDVRNGIAKTVVGPDTCGDVIDLKNIHLQSFSFSNHDECQGKWAYPYFVYLWASLMYDTGKRNDTFLRKENLFCLEQGVTQPNSFSAGSGVMIEEDGRYYIRGIAGLEFNLQRVLTEKEEGQQNDYKIFINSVVNANLSNNFSQNGSKQFPDGSDQDKMAYYNRNFVGLLKRYPSELENWSGNSRNLIGVIDIADYMDWIKKVRDEVDPVPKPWWKFW